MANSLFNMLGNSNNLPPQLQNIQNLKSRLDEFKKSFQGDPKEQVQQLLNSGKMSQADYNKLSQMATQIQNMLAKK